jgi:hypothetical protein
VLEHTHRAVHGRLKQSDKKHSKDCQWVRVSCKTFVELLLFFAGSVMSDWHSKKVSSCNRANDHDAEHLK